MPRRTVRARADHETGQRKETTQIATALPKDSVAFHPTARMRAAKQRALKMQTGRLGQVREIAAGPKAGTHARTLPLITATRRRPPLQMAVGCISNAAPPTRT